MSATESHGVLSPLAPGRPQGEAAAAAGVVDLEAPAPGGEVSALLRAFDWQRHPLGDPATWPRTLRGYVSMVLEMPTPAIIFWGPDQIQLYNDGYAVIMGPRHPAYFAAPYRECWPDTYPVIHPWMRGVLEEGSTIRVIDELFVLTRHGFAEEAYFTFTFSPLRDDEGAIGGILQPVVEVTASVLGERRTRTLSTLARRAESPEEALATFREAVDANPRDLPFALLYLADEAGNLALSTTAGFADEALCQETAQGLAAVAREVHAKGRPQLLADLMPVLGDRHVGAWPEPTRSAVAMPLGLTSAGTARGALVLGVSPRLRYDDRYAEFLDQVGRQAASTLGGAESRQVEAALLVREQSARREAELQKEHLATLLTQAPTPIVVLRGPDMVIELANPMTCRVWRREHAEIIDRPLLEALPELRGQVFEQLLDDVYRTGVTHVGREVAAEIARPDGGLERVDFNFVYAPLRAADGSVDGVLVIAFDVTEQVRAREQVEQLRSAAEAANRAKDDFFAVLGHELRNPLAPMLTALELMRLQGNGRLERERQVVERQAHHLVRLVDDLLDVSRIARGKVELRRERIDLADVVARAVELTAPLVEQRRHDLVVTVPAGLVVDADLVRLAQAFGNLLGNAAKYTEPGGTITVEAAASDGMVEVRVRDTGVGISPEVLPHVFELFVQERQALDRSPGGLGLGLAIVRGIVDLHGGTVAVRSEGLGAGTEVVVRLPVADAMPAAVTPAGTEVGADGHADGRTVLVVDDNRDAADLLAEQLATFGHRTHVAYDGVAALRLAGEVRPDLALLDIGLPVMDGYELARRLRELPGLGALPLVAITGYGTSDDRLRSQAAGFDAHLTKPVGGDRLAALVRQLTAAASDGPRDAGGG